RSSDFRALWQMASDHARQDALPSPSNSRTAAESQATAEPDRLGNLEHRAPDSRATPSPTSSTVPAPSWPRGAMHQRRRRLRVVWEHGWEFQSPRNFGAKAGGDLARRDASQIVVFAASGKERGGTDQSVMDVGVESALAV